MNSDPTTYNDDAYPHRTDPSEVTRILRGEIPDYRFPGPIIVVASGALAINATREV